MVKNAIKVFARLKPQKNEKDILNHQVYHRPKENVEEDFLFLVAPTQKSKDYPDNRPESWNFSFFRILEESTTQGEVFENVAKPVVESALDGYNGTIFAYGQTASGKTYTITGQQERPNDRGIIPRCLEYLFDVIRKRAENLYSVEVAYLEIYNENGYDLLDRRQRDQAVTRLEDLPRVTIQETENGQLHLKNLTFHCVGSAEEALELLLVGDNNRIIAETPMNPRSSRSHCIFTIVVSMKQFGEEQYRRAKVHLVDLAGSERVYKCSISGTILAEAKHINLSLHYLEQVIVCLGQESAGHIPYRNSFLTSILRDSLGGNCVTIMLATLSVEIFNLEETVSTCRFAQRVALIRNDVRMVLEKDAHTENTLLKLENERLKERIKALTRQMNSEDLTVEDKQNLDSQITNFLESDTEIRWDNNPKKVQYCFESFKRFFELSRDSDSCLKKVQYYKNMVLQRDKEISLLISRIKKDRGKKEKTNQDHCDLRPPEKELKSGENRGSVREDFQNKSKSFENVILSEEKSRVPNILEENEISILQRAAPKKQKRKLKVLKPVSQNIVTLEQELDDQKMIDYNKKNPPEESLNKIIPPHISCNVVNLTLENTNQQPLSKIERKKSKAEETQGSSKNNSGRKNKMPTEMETKLENCKSPITDETDFHQKDKKKTEETKLSFKETDYSVPFYQRFLNFNVPEEPIKSSKNDLIKSSRSSPKLNTQSGGFSVRKELEISNVESVSRDSLKYTPRKSKVIDNELENNRSKKIEEEKSVTDFRNDKCFDSSLPLTGDPEIDDEIIAFYKAKRSGGIY